jgi:hypothetical protein
LFDGVAFPCRLRNSFAVPHSEPIFGFTLSRSRQLLSLYRGCGGGQLILSPAAAGRNVLRPFRRGAPMSILQIGFVVRSGVSALVIAFLLSYEAQHEWGLSGVAVRTGALLAALLIANLVALELFGKSLRKPK